MATTDQFKVIVNFDRRPDGGVRVWSPDVPGLVLSGRDRARIVADVTSALEVILSEQLECRVTVTRLERKPRPTAVVRPAAH